MAYRKIWTAVLAACGMGWNPQERRYYVNLDLTVAEPGPHLNRRIHARFTPAQARSLASTLTEYAARVEAYEGNGPW